MAKGKSHGRRKKWTWREIIFYGVTFLIALSMVLSTVLWAMGK